MKLLCYFLREENDRDVSSSGASGEKKEICLKNAYSHIIPRWQWSTQGCTAVGEYIAMAVRVIVVLPSFRRPRPFYLEERTEHRPQFQRDRLISQISLEIKTLSRDLFVYCVEFGAKTCLWSVWLIGHRQNTVCGLTEVKERMSTCQSCNGTTQERYLN